MILFFQILGLLFFTLIALFIVTVAMLHVFGWDLQLSVNLIERKKGDKDDE